MPRHGAPPIPADLVLQRQTPRLWPKPNGRETDEIDACQRNASDGRGAECTHDRTGGERAGGGENAGGIPAKTLAAGANAGRKQFWKVDCEAAEPAHGKEAEYRRKPQ